MASIQPFARTGYQAPTYVFCVSYLWSDGWKQKSEVWTQVSFIHFENYIIDIWKGTSKAFVYIDIPQLIETSYS